MVKQRKKELKIKALKELLKKGKENNFAFIDSQNLNLNIRNQGWILDFARFHRYLKEKYSVNKAFLFVGYVEDNKKRPVIIMIRGYAEKAGYYPGECFALKIYLLIAQTAPDN